MAKGKYAKKRLRKQLRECSIKESGLSTRVANALDKAGIHSLADLVREDDNSLSLLPGIGESAMEEILKVKNNISIQ